MVRNVLVFMEKPYRLLYPMGVVLVSSSHEGQDNVMTACWAFPLSIDPILFGVSIGKERHSFGFVNSSKEFVLNVPGEELLDAAIICGENSGKDTDKFELAKLTREKSEKVSAPSIAEALTSIECKVIYSVEAGDHVLFIGEPVNIKERKSGKKLIQNKEGLITSF
jgi:flavin reductase (DIM6/NTAB) family NADH-FMN oxidoreductase RutF